MLHFALLLSVTEMSCAVCKCLDLRHPYLLPLESRRHYAWLLCDLKLTALALAEMTQLQLCHSVSTMLAHSKNPRQVYLRSTILLRICPNFHTLLPLLYVAQSLHQPEGQRIRALVYVYFSTRLIQNAALLLSP